MTGKKISNNKNDSLLVLSALIDRAVWSARLGQSFGDKRDIYEALGYKKDLTYADYRARYDRDPVAGAIIDEPVDACWSEFPEIFESDDSDETKFEKEAYEIIEKLNLLTVFSRADRLAGIGRYSVLLLGFSDGADLSVDVKKGSRLLYVTPYSEDSAGINKYDTNTASPRYGLPIEYQINVSNGTNGSLSKNVHFNRIIHIAEGCLENSIEGTPKLKRPFNYLQGLELVACGSPEMFWRGALPGMVLKGEPGITLTDDEKAKITDELEKYLHNLQRFLRTGNMDVKELAPQVADPLNHISSLIDLIACGARIPKRVLLGSERGELASSQDEKNYMARIKRRRQIHCDPVIIRQFFDRLIAFGAITKPTQKYSIKWSDPLALSEKEIADLGSVNTQSLVAYSNSSASDIIPPHEFLRDVLGFSEERVALIEAAVDKLLSSDTEESPPDNDRNNDKQDDEDA